MDEATKSWTAAMAALERGDLTGGQAGLSNTLAHLTRGAKPPRGMKFHPGRLNLSAGFSRAATPEGDNRPDLKKIAALLHRHLTGDWGDVTADVKKANAAALKTGARLVSAYKLGRTKVAVVSDPQHGPTRHSTMFKLPTET